ncbi:MFS transporter [Aquibacillus salsiterrae]|uniref:MFS transporter n=1 Tax=Aquibacillus salsiterrae TaxID=2950439 RepID=A0A9X4AEN4_9BACI|nr:MFS transporter [Aquibacillus salsiterrae]MDC3416996.1 MFS transporter [Aquibacillus salsiterrae]
MPKNPFFKTSLYYTLIFMATSSLVSYISLFYAEMDVVDSKIGILTSVGAIIGVLANPFWGVRGDRAKAKNNVLRLCLLFAACFVWLFPLLGNNFLLLLLVACSFYFFQSAINPLSDAISLELSAKENFQFSNVRTFGSLGFAVMSVIAGSLIEYSIDAIFILYSSLMFIALIVSFWIPNIKGYQQDRQKVKFWQVLKSRSLRRIYLYTLILSTGFGFFISFHALYSVEQGISVGLLGIGIMIGSFSQFPFMLFFDKLYEKLGIRKIILISGLFNVTRWTLYAVWLNSYTILFLWLLHGGSFILVYLCLAEYVHRHVQKELKVSGQMMNFIVLQGAGQIIGGIVGGFFADLYSYGIVFASLAVISLIGVFYFWYSTRSNKALVDDYPVQTDQSSAL